MFVLGAEREGLPDDVLRRCDERATIPTPGPGRVAERRRRGSDRAPRVGPAPPVGSRRCRSRGFSITPVKGLALHHPDGDRAGAPRRHREPALLPRRRGRPAVRGRAPRAARAGAGRLRRRPERLALRFPDGRVVDGEVELGAADDDRLLRPRRRRATRSTARGRRRCRRSPAARCGCCAPTGRATAPTSTSRRSSPAPRSRSSAAARASTASLDARRFRMLLEIDGCGPHEEDTWRDRLVRVGDAVLRMGKPVPRCAVTTQDPATGVPRRSTRCA